MLEPAVSPTHAAGRFKRWLLSERIEQVEEPETRESAGRQRPAPDVPRLPTRCDESAAHENAGACRAPAHLVQKSGRDGGGKPRPDYALSNLSP